MKLSASVSAPRVLLRLLAGALLLGLAGCAAVITRPLEQAPLLPIPEAAPVGGKSPNGMAPPMVRVVDPRPTLLPGFAQQLQTNVPPQRLLTPGLPYFLPKAVYDVSLTSVKDEKGQHKEFAIKSTPRLIADPQAGFVLSSPENLFASKHHTMKVKDGLLTSVITEDEGKLGEILTTLASTVLNVMSYSQARAGAQGKQVDESVPDDAELLAIFTAITPGEQTFGFWGDKQPSIEVPGTSGVLYLKVRVHDEMGGSPGLDPAPTSGAVQQSYGGVYARVLKPKRYELVLQVNKMKFYEKRAKDLPKKYAANAKLIDAANERIKVLPGLIQGQVDDAATYSAALKKALTDPITPVTAILVADYREQVKTALAAADTLRKELETQGKTVTDLTKENTEIGKDETVDGKRKRNKDQIVTQGDLIANATPATLETTEYHQVFSRSGMISVPDESTAVQIPVTGALFGASKNSLTLESGIVVEVGVQKPSQALGTVKVFYDLTEAIIALPAKIVQLKIDYASKDKELAEKLKARDLALDDLKKYHTPAGPKPELTPHEKEVKALQAEMEIVSLQKQLAEMRAAIIRAETQPLVPPPVAPVTTGTP